jgi:hypothetical protein
MPLVRFEMPDALLAAVKHAAARLGISAEGVHFITLAAEEKIAALTTVEYLHERAARGSIEKLHSILDRVPHVPPDPGDEP